MQDRSLELTRATLLKQQQKIFLQQSLPWRPSHAGAKVGKRLFLHLPPGVSSPSMPNLCQGRSCLSEANHNTVKWAVLQGSPKSDPVSPFHLGQPTCSPGCLTEPDKQCVNGPGSPADSADSKLHDTFLKWMTSTPSNQTPPHKFKPRVYERIANQGQFQLVAKNPYPLPSPTPTKKNNIFFSL